MDGRSRHGQAFGRMSAVFLLLVVHQAAVAYGLDVAIAVDGHEGSVHYKAVNSFVQLQCAPSVAGAKLYMAWLNVQNFNLRDVGDPLLRQSEDGYTLNITEIQQSRHAGRWACRAAMCQNQSEIYGRCRTKTAFGYTTIHVLQPPDVKISEKQINVVAGQRLVVNCHLAGASPINVSFYLNDVFLESASHGRYITLAATPQHQGTFKCVNRNDLLNMSATATTEIVVLEPPEVEMTPKSVKVYSGTTVTVECQGVNLDSDIQPVGLIIRRGRPRRCYAQYLRRCNTSAVRQEQSAVLQFSKITEHNAGYYHCEATSPCLAGCSSGSFQEIKVEVADRPPSSELLISGTDSRPVVRYAGHHRQVNRELILTCQSWDNTDGLTLETLWYHNDVLIKQGTQHFNFGWRNRTLLFRDNPFVTSMSGNYSCSVNYKGFPEINVTRTDPISVFIREPPQTRVIANGQEFEVGQTFSAICYMNVGNGKERFVEWRRRVGNTSYPVLSQYVNSTMAILKMPNLNLRDAGEYHCVGTDPEIGHQSLRSFASSATLVVRQPVPNIRAQVPTAVVEGTSSTSEGKPTGTDEGGDIQYGGSPVTDDKLYITVAIVGSVVAILFAVFIFILLGYIRRRTKSQSVKPDQEESGKANKNKQQSTPEVPNGHPRPTKLMLVNMTENSQYESVLVAAQTSSDEKKKDCITLNSHDDGIADCSQVDTDLETSSGAGIPVRTSVRLAKTKSSRSKGSLDTDLDFVPVTPTQAASDMDSEFYSEPLDRSIHTRTSIRSFASAMKDEGSRTPRGVILRKVQKAGSGEGDNYSLPQDATIQVIDPDMEANSSAPVASRRSSANIVPVDDYSLPLDGKSGGEALFVRTGTGKSSRPAARNSSILSVRTNGAVVSTNVPSDSSRSPSPVDESLYAEPYAEPPTNMDAMYSTLRRSQRYRDICPDNIVLENELGSGRFGNVYRGVWTEASGSRLVAVKTLKDDVDPHERLLFLQEAAIMGQFRHKNLVRLFGVVTQGSTLMIVEELMSSDNLRQFLLKHRPDDSGLPNDLQLELLEMCKGVADGMSYLAHRGFVHRDLAARNILLDSDRTCKIGDFGMSRGMESDHYESSGGVIPVKWSAPEAIEYRSFSSASDVWSYGIVLYEIWTFGKCPYSWWDNEQVMVKIKEGYRLPRPDHCPPALYNLMKDCWEEDKSFRPSFEQILRRLDGPPEALLRMPKSLSTRKGKQHVRAVFMPEGGAEDSSDSSCSGKADTSDQS